MYFVIFVFGENFPSRPGSRLGRRQDSTECPDQQELVPTHGLAIKVAFPKGSSCSKLEFYEQG